VPGSTGFPNSTGNYIADIGNGNPASLNNFEGISLGFSWQLKSSIQPAWTQQISHKRDKNYLPQSLLEVKQHENSQ